MVDIKNVLKSLSDPMKTVGADKVMVQERDKSVPEKMNSFIVVSLPTTIYNKTYGEGYGWSNTFCRVEIYVRRKAGRIQLVTLNDLSNKVQSVFPICDKVVNAKNPRVLLSTDNDGFDIVTIQATLNIIG